VYVGRFAKEKRLDYLIDCWRSIQEHSPLATLYLIGTGDEETKLKGMQTEGIRVLKPVADVVPFLQAADLFVLPSEREGLSNSMLEAMSCGLPVVATNVGGALDVIRDGQNGFLVPVDDRNAFEKTLLTVLRDPWLRRTIGAESSRSILKQYSIANTAKMLRSLYDSLLIKQDCLMDHAS
jgi:glycosyltransferase involved in cell wall biosynthesis